jgi:hypothetical protein
MVSQRLTHIFVNPSARTGPMKSLEPDTRRGNKKYLVKNDQIAEKA